MKKAYTVPMLVPSGNVLCGTLSGDQELSEGGGFKSMIAGSAGYYL